MELNSLKSETKELIMNALSIYYALQEQSKLYRQDGMKSLSLYIGVLRLGKTVTIVSREPIQKGPGTGYPYPNGIRPSTRGEKTEYRWYTHNYDNIVCQILNEYGITVEQVVAMLNLDEKLTTPVKYSVNEKIERQYNAIYKTLLQTIRNYYIASVKYNKEDNKHCKPLVEMDIPTIISAIHYPNIDASNSIIHLHEKWRGEQSLLGTMPDYLNKIESNVYYKEEMGRQDKNGQIELYQEKKPLVMNKNIGKII